MFDTENLHRKHSAEITYPLSHPCGKSYIVQEGRLHITSV